MLSWTVWLLQMQSWTAPQDYESEINLAQPKDRRNAGCCRTEALLNVDGSMHTNHKAAYLHRSTLPKVLSI